MNMISASRAFVLTFVFLMMASALQAWLVVKPQNDDMVYVSPRAAATFAALPDNDSDFPTPQAKPNSPKAQQRYNRKTHPVPNWIAPDEMLVDPALVFAMVRKESNFNPRARNARSGAKGAMQLLPSTASYVIKRFNLNDTPQHGRTISSGGLYDPVVNLTVGQHYIKYLSDKPYIEGNIVYLLTAYNAGPGNLRAWKKRFGNSRNPQEFINNIPFKETRQYVRQVLNDYAIYSQMLYGADNHYLKNGPWPILKTQSYLQATVYGRQYAANSLEPSVMHKATQLR